MAFEVKNPFKGLSKPQVYAVIAGSTGIGGLLAYRHHKQTGSWNPFSHASAAGNGTQINPVTGMAYSQDNVTDPITGQTYLAEAQQYGSVQAAEAAISQFGGSSDTGTGIGINPASGVSDGSSNAVPGSVSTNTYSSPEAWAQAATIGLAEIGFSETDVATALGGYLSGTPLTPQQVTYVNNALAEFPYPGTPPQIIRQPIHTPGPDMKTVPYVIGLDLEEAQRDITGAGLKSTFTGPAFKPGTGTRIVTEEHPAPGTKLTAGSNVKLTYKVNRAGGKKG